MKGLEIVMYIFCGDSTLEFLCKKYEKKMGKSSDTKTIVWKKNLFVVVCVVPHFYVVIFWRSTKESILVRNASSVITAWNYFLFQVILQHI